MASVNQQFPTPKSKIALGVCGGIAAYKSLELARLATVAGHGVRVLMTENASRFVGAASFEGIIGAPVLESEFERDPLGGAFPGDPAPGHIFRRLVIVK